MSKLTQANGDDHPDAAAKHLVDAQGLYAAARHDNAGYLAGYVVECCLKTVVLAETGTFHGGHNLNGLSVRVLTLAAVAGSKTAKYVSTLSAVQTIYDPASGWHPELRYRPEGQVTAAIAAQWVQEAENIYKMTIVPMRLDGVI